MIHRTHKDSHFTILSNSLVRHQRLSYEAKAVLADVLSHDDAFIEKYRLYTADGYETYSKMHYDQPIGRKPCLRVFRELVAEGYIDRKRIKLSSTKFTWEVVLYEEPGCRNGTVETSTEEPGCRSDTVETDTMATDTMETGPSNRRTREKNQRESSSPDDDDAAAIDVSREQAPGFPSAPVAGGLPGPTASRSQAGSRAGSARSSAARPSREDRGLAEEVINDINELLDHESLKVLQLSVSMGLGPVTRLLGRFPAIDLVDAVEWRFYTGGYAGNVWVNDGSRNPAAVFLSRLGDLADEWIKFRAEHGVQTYDEYAAKDQAEEAAADAAEEPAQPDLASEAAADEIAAAIRKAIPVAARMFRQSVNLTRNSYMPLDSDDLDSCKRRLRMLIENMRMEADEHDDPAVDRCLDDLTALQRTFDIQPDDIHEIADEEQVFAAAR